MSRLMVLCVGMSVACSMGGCAVSNLPSTARPVGAGRSEFGISTPVSVRFADDDTSRSVPILRQASYGGSAGLDFEYTRGLSDGFDVTIASGTTGNANLTAKLLLFHAGPLWMSGYGMGRGYFAGADGALFALGGLVGTIGNGSTTFTFGGFGGHWWGIDPAPDGSAEPRSRYFGGGFGVEKDVEGMAMRGMIEVQRYGLPADVGTTLVVLTAHVILTGPRNRR